MSTTEPDEPKTSKPAGVKQVKRKTVAPVADEAFANRQLNLFQGFFANTTDQREALTNREAK